MRRPNRQKRLLAYLSSPVSWILLAFIVRFIYLYTQADHPLFTSQTLDEKELFTTAQRLARGQGFDPAPLFKAPLYPLFVSLIMRLSIQWMWLTRLIQHILGALLVGMCCDAARRSVPENLKTISVVIVGVILSFYGPLIRLENRIILDALFVFLQGAMLWAVTHLIDTDRMSRSLSWTVLAGLAACASVLTRPTVIPVLIPLALLTAWFVRRNAWYSRTTCLFLALLFLVPSMLAIVGTGWRNHQVSQEWLFTPWQGGYNFYHANSTNANGRYLKQSYLSENTTGNPTYDAAIAGFQAKHQEHVDNINYGNINRFWFVKARNDILADPARWISLMFKKSLYLLNEREIFNFEDYSIQRDLSLVLRMAFFGFGIIWPLAFASLILPFRSDDTAHTRILLWCYILLMGGAITLFYTSGRLRMPLVFPATILAAGGLSRFMALSPPRRAVYILLLAIGAILSWTNWWGVRSERLHQYEYARFSQSYWEAADYQKALDFALLCEQENANYPTLPLLKAQAYYGLEDIPNAHSDYLEAVRKLPGNTTALCNLGIIEYYQHQDISSAKHYFLKCLKSQPKHKKAAWMLARIALCNNEPARAADLLLHSSPPAPPPLDYLISAYAVATITDSPQARELRNEITQKYGKDTMLEADEELYLIRQKQALPTPLQ